MDNERTRIVSGDTHLELDSKWWIDRVPEIHRARAPRVIQLADGGDAWLVEGIPLRETPQDLYGGKGRGAWTPFGQSYETTAGTGPASQRLSEQDEDGVDAEVLFPGVSGPGLWRNIRDDEAYLAVVRAYNSFLAEEYCATDPARLLGIGVIPQSGIEDALAELTWCKRAGLHGVLLSRFPNGGGVPRAVDDRFWAEALELQMPITAHVEMNLDGVSSLLEYPDAKPGVLSRVSGSRQFAEQTTKMARNAGINALQLTLSGVFDRFPELEIFFAETQIGWIPLFLEVAEQRFARHSGWAQDLLGWKPLKEGTPSGYIRRHVYWGFQQDRTGMKLRDDIGVDKLIWGSDFPHQESDWPHSKKVLEINFEGVPEEEQRLMTCGNISRFLHL